MRYLVLLLIMALSVSCHNSATTDPQDNQLPSIEELSRITVKQSGYNQLTIKANDNFLLPDSNMTMVQIGYYRQDTLHLICEQALQFTDVNGRQRMQFEMIFSVAAGTLYFPLTVRYLFKGCSHLEIDSTIVMCRYPYVNSEVVLRWSDIDDDAYSRISDFDINGSFLYYLNAYSDKVYEYDLNNDSRRAVLHLPNAAYMCSDSDFIFLTVDQDGLYRLDLRNDSLKKIIHFDSSFAQNHYFGGVVSVNKRLVVNQRDTKLYVYDYDGNLLETHSDVSTGRTLGIHNDIIYSAFSDLLSRYDLSVGSRLDPRPLPDADTDAVKVVNGYLYFSSSQKDFLGRTPIEDVDNYSDGSD